MWSIWGKLQAYSLWTLEKIEYSQHLVNFGKIQAYSLCTLEKIEYSQHLVNFGQEPSL